MTSDEIRALEAGPKLDRLVARKVMGWSPTPGWNPSISLLDAWEVVEKLTGGMIQFRLEKTESGWVYAKFVDCTGRPHVRGGASAKETPLAICRAALLAVEDGVRG